MQTHRRETQEKVRVTLSMAPKEHEMASKSRKEECVLNTNF